MVSTPASSKKAAAGKPTGSKGTKAAPTKAAELDDFMAKLKEARRRGLVLFEIKESVNNRTIGAAAVEKKATFKTPSALVDRFKDGGHYRMVSFSEGQFVRRALTVEQFRRLGQTIWGKFSVVACVAVLGITHVDGGAGPTLASYAEVEAFLGETAELMATAYKVERAEPVVLTPEEVTSLLGDDYDKDDPEAAEFKRAIRDFSG